MTLTTGPKISSRAIRIAGVTPAKTVGAMKKPWASSPSMTLTPPVASRGALLPADADVVQDLPPLGLVDQRSHMGLRSRRPLPSRIRAARSARIVHETVIDTFMDDDAAGGGAALAAGAEASPESPFQRQFQVGVIHDDDGVLSPHLQGQGAMQLGQQPLQPLARGAGAGEGGRIDAGMGAGGIPPPLHPGRRRDSPRRAGSPPPPGFPPVPRRRPGSPRTA